MVINLDYNKFVSEKICIGNQSLNQKKNILLCGDSKYIKYVGVTLTSIAVNNSSSSLAFHIICDDIEKTDLDKLEKVNQLYGCTIIIYKLDTALIKDLAKSVNKDSHVNVAGLFRLIGFCIIPDEIENVLYMDSDILVTGKLDDFYDTTLSDKEVAIVVEDLESEMHQKEIGVPNYFNSGVMYVNIRLWKDLNLLEKCLEIMFSGKKYRFVDQDVLNIVLQNKTKFFPNKFNFMYRLNHTFSEKNFSEDYPVIWHFIGISKPWHSWTQEFTIVKRYNSIVKNSYWYDNRIITINDIKDLKTKYKVYKIISRGCKKKGNISGYFINTLKYCVAKFKHNIVN